MVEKRRRFAPKSIMNYLPHMLLASVLTTGAFAQSHTQAPTPSAPAQIMVESEAKDLANGYALAFSQLSRPPLTLAFQKEGVLRILEDVKAVRAAEGVLVIEVGRGLIYVINPTDIVYLTDGPQITKNKAAEPAAAAALTPKNGNRNAETPSPKKEDKGIQPSENPHAPQGG